MRRDQLVTIPNIFSLARVACAAGILVSRGTAERVALIGIATATDFLDGWFARRRNMASRLGALLDPIADRIFVLSAVAVFLVEGKLSLAQCFALLARDVATVIGYVVSRIVPWLRQVPFQARYLGKVVTVLQLATLLALLLAPPLAAWLLIAVATLSMAAIADYTLVLWRARPS